MDGPAGIEEEQLNRQVAFAATDDVLFGRNRELPGTPVVNGIQLLGGSFRRGSPTRVRTPPQLASFFIGWRGIQ